MTVPGNLSSPLLATAAAAAAAGDVATKSLRFDSGSSAYLNRTPSSAGNRKTFTFSAWVKKTSTGSTFAMLGTGTDSTNLDAFDFNGEQLRYTRSTSGSFLDVKTDAVFRDPSAWYHVVLAVDTTQSTASDRVKIYVNGVQQTSLSASNYPSQNEDTFINSTEPQVIGRRSAHQDNYFDGLMADAYLVDGSQLDATSFGAYDDNGVWQAAAYSGTFGTNGFHLSFSDATSTTTIAEDSSGNGNDFTANNISVTAGAGNDSLFDAPTNGSQSDTGAGGEVSGNYCTWNPVAPVSTGSDLSTLSNGNLEGTTSNSTVSGALGTIGVSSGKWYFEITCGAFTGGTGLEVGVAQEDIQSTIGTSEGPGDSANGYFYINDGRKVNNGSASSYGASYTDGDIIGIALDLDDGHIEFFKNGSSQGNAYTSLNSGTYFPCAGDYNASGTASFTANFGQRAFSYSAPSNHKALCTTNLPTPTIADGSEYFDIALYTGATQSPRTITGLNIAEPDWVWVKNRSDSKPHLVWDAVRGTDKNLNTTVTAHESDVSGASQGIISTSASNGFVVKNGSSGGLNVGSSGSNSYVAWCWEAGTSTVSNTDGSITSNVRASQTNGISIVSYTGNATNGATVGHGLNAEIGMIIIKNRDDGGTYWVTYHSALGGTKALALNRTDSVLTNSLPFNNTNPTSSVFTIGAGGSFSYSNNQSGENHVAYCISPVAGHSAVGSYTGNASQDGPFVYCGFRPAFILWKRSDAAANWYIQDSARTSFNPANGVLRPNTSEVELTSSQGQIMDALSNGFRVKNNGTEHNASGGTYVWACFAENPFQANGGLAR